MMNFKKVALKVKLIFHPVYYFFQTLTWVELKKADDWISELKGKEPNPKALLLEKLTDEWCPIYLPVSLLNRIWFEINWSYRSCGYYNPEKMPNQIFEVLFLFFLYFYLRFGLYNGFHNQPLKAYSVL